MISTLGLVASLALASAVARSEPRRFEISGGAFLLDGKPLQIVSGELHYARIPHEYWRDRLRRARALGLNTIATYVFWNFHQRLGSFDFRGDGDLATFVRTAQKEGLFVILRPGPYVCAEWDFGGFPARLLDVPGMDVRSRDERFLEASARYLKAVGDEVATLQITQGGPILMVQVENEYGSFGDDAEYLARIRDQIRGAGFEVPLFTADGPSQMPRGAIPDVLPAINGATGQDVFDTIRKFRPEGPFFVAELYPGWLDHWGEPHSRVDAATVASQVDGLLAKGASVNLFMFHGGTSFGFWNGANFGGRYQPQPTSYDYDAPLDEAGRPTPKYFALREVIAKHLPEGVTIPEPPPQIPTIEIPSVALSESLSLESEIGAPVRSYRPRTMESVGQSTGWILYRTRLDALARGMLVVKELRDYAVVLVDGKRVASLDRRHRQFKVPIDVPRAGAVLDLLVENGGRINYGEKLRDDRKGITESVFLDGREIVGFEIHPLRFVEPPRSGFATMATSESLAFRRGTFDLETIGDTFLDLRSFGKGVVWVNGRNVGRFWSIGPQRTLYVPAPWLRVGRNELVVFDAEDRGARTIAGLREPILDQLGDDPLAPKRPERRTAKPSLDPADLVREGAFAAGDAPQDVRFDAINARFVALESRSSLGNDPFASIAECFVLGPDGAPASRDAWKVAYVDSEETSAESGLAEHAFDDDASTIWHSQWSDAKPPHPHLLVIDLGAAVSIGGIRYVPRAGDRPGKIASFRLFARATPFR